MLMNAGETILSRGLPKTGQVVIYDSVDDGFYQAGWWVGEKFNGHRLRFIPKTIGIDEVVIDRATGLMWAANGNASINNLGVTLTWSLAVAFPSGKPFAGFTDWRAPNINELLSLVDYSKSNPCIDEELFPNTVATKYWSSTTYIGDTDDAWPISFVVGDNRRFAKTSQCYLRAVRGGR